MKKKQFLNPFTVPIVALVLSAGAVSAGEVTTATTEAKPAVESNDVISGILKLDFNTHFVSYGLDVWGDGSSMSDPTFNPNLELYFALPADLTLTLGTWWDVNSKSGSGNSPIGGRVQEVDVYGGLAYTIDKFTVGVTYQAWMYSGDTENILDVRFAYDRFLAPSLTIHNRLDQGAAAGDEGTVLVLGLSHSIEAGPMTVSFPVNVGYFLTDEYHRASAGGVDGADSGFGYASVGVAASLPLTSIIGDGFGEWTLNGGLTYFITDNSVIPSNPQENFLAASLGLAVAF